MRLAIAILIATVTPAAAHDWYSTETDPVTMARCCGGQDCAPLKVEPGMIEAVEDGYRLRLTLEQAQAINPKRTQAVDTLVEWDRIQPSPDGNWHVCIPNYYLPSMRADIYCFWEPGAM